jgi:7-cyano-7-deazaguanine synthase
MAKAVVIYSGGMDSFTTLHLAIHEGYDVEALTVDYGQRHRKELNFAAEVTRELGIPHRIVDLSVLNSVLGGSALTDDMDVPEGHYAQPNMKQTVVPNRNMILLSVAAGRAVAAGAGYLFYGAHSGDHAIYPDCRPEFVEAVNKAVKEGNYDPPTIVAPFINNNKTDILNYGLRMGLDYSKTWTCYNGRGKACGKCGACVERLESFAELGEADPLPYEQE